MQIEPFFCVNISKLNNFYQAEINYDFFKNLLYVSLIRFRMKKMVSTLLDTY